MALHNNMVVLYVFRAVLSVPSSSRFARSAEAESMIGQFKQLLRDLHGDLRSSLSGFPQWLPRNVGSLTLWGLLAVLSLCLGRALGLPPMLLLAMTILLLGMPADASPQWQRAVETLLPTWLSNPSSAPMPVDAAAGRAAPPVAAASPTDSARDSRADLSGVWKRVRLVNYENLMGAQGAGFVQRRLAASVAMTHTITMDPDLTAFRLMEKGGPVDTDNTYQIGGPEITTNTLKVGPFIHIHVCVWRTYAASPSLWMLVAVDGLPGRGELGRG